VEAAERAREAGGANADRLKNRLEVLTRAAREAEEAVGRTEADAVRNRAHVRLEGATAAAAEAGKRLEAMKERHAAELAAALDDHAVSTAVLDALARAARPA
jgi:hypothetical protein